MTQLAEPAKSSALDGAPVCLRQDLQIVPIERGLNVTYTVKDPVNLKYYELDEQEMALLQRLDGKTSWEDLRLWFNRRFPPLRLTHHALQAMVWRLHQQGLVTTTAADQGRRQALRAQQLRRRELSQRLSQPWAIRLPGVDPGAWLKPLLSCLGWLFAPWFVIPVGLCLIVLFALALSQYAALVAMEPSAAEFFSRENMLLLGLVIILTKVVHELGHAAAAHRQGCECHEIGVLLLAGMPLLFCDVSDAWMLPQRWRRIVVSLAGIWLEILIAAAAFIVWSLSVPGLVHSISFNVMAVCSVGTLLFNANPLVRYDGYYVLMDLTGVSNLGQRSNEALGRWFNRWVLGSREERPLDAPEIPWWCFAYGVAAAGYRIFLTFAILWGLHFALKPYAASVLVWLVAAMGLVTWGISMSRSFTHQVRRTTAIGTPTWRVAVGLAVVVGGLAAFTLIPLPWYVFGEAVLEPADRQMVVATVPGKPQERQEAGVPVQAGDLVAKLENRDIERELEDLSAQHRFQGQRLQALLTRRNQDVRAAEQIPGAEAAFAALEHRIAYLHEEQHRLELRTTESGRFYPAPFRFEKLDEIELPGWNGTLLDPINRDAWINAGDAVGQIGSVDRLEAVAVLSQDDMEAVAVGQPASIFLKSSGRTIRGEVSSISRLEVDANDEMAGAPPLGGSGKDRLKPGLQPYNKWYQVQIRCTEPCPEGTLVRSRGKVRIHIGSRTVGEWVALQFFKTFRWRA